MKKLSPPNLWIKLIMSCISTSSIQVIMNGALLPPFLPSRGIGQIEMFGHMIEEEVTRKQWEPLENNGNH